MADILSNFYRTNYKKNNINNNVLTPTRNLKLKTDTTAQHLSPHGIYLSENNTLLISKKKYISPLSLTLTKQLNIKNNNYLLFNSNLKTQINNINGKEKKLSTTINNNKDKKNTNCSEHELKTCFSYTKKNKILMHKINKTKNNELLNSKKNLKADSKMLIINKNTDENIINNKKSRNIFTDFSSLQGRKNNPTYSSNNYHSTVSILSNYSNKENKTYYKTINKEKNLFYKGTKRDKINTKIEAEKITKELLSLKTKKDIKSFYIKKDYAKAIAEAENNEKNKLNMHNSIDPMTYIKFNLSNYPKNNNLFKSFDTQIVIMGNQKYRNDLLEGVNAYKNNCVKYEDMRGPIGNDKNNVNEIKRNEIIKKMKMNYISGRGLIFSNRLYKKRYPKKNDFEFDDNYKEVQKFLYKNIDKYEKQIKVDNGKRVAVNVDENDIKTLKKIDDNAEFIVHDKNEMIKFSHRFLSFDEKIDKLLSKIRNTTSYLFKRTQEHHKIKKKIDEIYDHY